MAWAHGPVVLEVYRFYSDPYDLAFSEQNEDDMASVKKISENEYDQKILENVCEVFCQYSAWKLRNMTHEEDPWIEATDGGYHLDGIISRVTMKSYFMENYATD